MKSETVLDSAVFQLTPTRTRCELVIKANGKTEKIASGLLNPFLSHLKTAKDQIAKGGYSIVLEPDPGADTMWFTKGTVERFVRFVSTPEVLERVNTVESEIIQIEEAIVMQGNEMLHSNSVEEDLPKSVEYPGGGGKSAVDADAGGKAIVIYKPGTPASDSSGEKMAPREENSKVQLLRVLETRKAVLQKEQGMAFARAMAAGFTVENIAHLISFAECFGAARLLEASSKFMELYHGKHETGQWLEIDATDAMSMRSDFMAMNTSGITLSADIGRQREHREQWPAAPNNDSNEGSNGKINGGDINPDLQRDARINGDFKMSGGPNEYFQGQFPHPMYPQWPVHSPAGMPVFQPYAMQGMPFYQNYPPGSPYFPPPYAPSEAPSHHKPRKNKSKKRSGDGRRSAMEESESPEASDQSQDDDEDDDDDNDAASDVEKEVSGRREQRRKSGKSGGKKSGMVVIKNLNYITSKKRNNHASGGESTTASNDSESEGGSHFDATGRNERRRKSSTHDKSKGSSKGNRTKPAEMAEEEPLSIKEEAAAYGQQLADSDNWQVFQSFLLRDEDEKERGEFAADAAGMFSGEKKPAVRRRQQGQPGEDLILPPERDFEEFQGRKLADDLDTTANGRYSANRAYKHKGLNDDNFQYVHGGLSRDGKQYGSFEEIEVGGRGGYRRGTSEEFVVYGQDKHFSNVRNASDPIAENEFDPMGHLPKDSGNSSSCNVVSDESFIVPVRLGSEQNERASRTEVVMDMEFPPFPQEPDASNAVSKSQPNNYEPDDLNLMPEREMDRDFSVGGYDPAMDYEMEARVETANTVVENGEQQDPAAGKEEMKEKEKKLRVPQDGSRKMKAEPGLGRGRLSRLNPLAQAQERADKLRAYKADLQKAKKEKEAEAIKRLEALKLERQKRIAARSSGAAPSPSTGQRKATQTQASISPSTQRGSKFSDSPASPALLQRRLPLRGSAVVPASGSDARKHSAGSGVSRSVSSLSDGKKDARAAAPSRSVSSLSDAKKNKAAPPPQVSKADKGDVGDIRAPSSALNHPVRGDQDLFKPVRNKPPAVEAPEQKDLGEAKPKKGVEKIQQPGSGDENAVVEKIVVVHEHKSPNAPKKPVHDEHAAETENLSSAFETVGKTEILSGYAAIRAPPTPIVKCEVIPGNDVAALCSLADQPAKACKASEVCGPDEAYQPPHAQTTPLHFVSWEEKASTPEEAARVPPRVGDACIVGEEEHETAAKPRSKESLKGFKKLLKFGRKSHGAPHGEPCSELDASSSVDEQAPAGSEAQSLSDIIAIPEGASIEGVLPKGDKSGSRHFSILSPFRGKHSEKKSSPA